MQKNAIIFFVVFYNIFFLGDQESGDTVSAGSEGLHRPPTRLLPTPRI